MKLLIDDTTGEVALVPPGVQLEPLDGQTLRGTTESELDLIAQGGFLRIVAGELVAELPPVPIEVPAWRLHAIAGRTPHLGGTLAEAIDAAIAALPEPARTDVHASWHRGTVVRRDSPTVQQLAAALGLNASGLDYLFREAAAIAV
jgi:hypothetical protein